MTNASRPVRLRWLGQAGFAITAPTGEVLLTDPYLSDSAWDDTRTPRIAPIVADPAQLRVTASVTSHWHGDHLDRPTSEALFAADPDILFIGPPANVFRLTHWWHLPESNARTLTRDGQVAAGPFTVHGNFARHDVPGMVCEDAISFVVEVAGVRVFHSGDTEYDTRIRQAALDGPLDVGLYCINGTGGNMNVHEAALLAHQMRPRLAIPMHYGMWPPEHYGEDTPDTLYRRTTDPAIFIATLRRLGEVGCRILELDEEIVIYPSATGSDS